MCCGDVTIKHTFILTGCHELVMRGWRVYPRALRMIHGSGNKKLHSDYLRVDRIISIIGKAVGGMTFMKDSYIRLLAV